MLVSSPGCRPRADERCDRARAGGQGPGPPPCGARTGRPGAAERPAPGAGDGSRARSSSALLGSPNLASRALGLRAVRLNVREHGRRTRSRRSRSCGSRGRLGRSWRRPTANQAVGALDPWLGAALSVAEATRNVSITGARPLGVTNCLNFGDPTRPEAFWQLRRESAASATPAARSACRSPAATCPSTTSPRRARSRRRRRSASSACSRTSTRSSARPSGRGRRGSCSSARRPGLSGSEYARLAGIVVGDDTRRPSTSPARPRLQAFVREAIGRGLVASAQDVSGGGLAVALARCGDLGRPGRTNPARRSRTRRRSISSARARRDSS
jgi:hypothetical protein